MQKTEAGAAGDEQPVEDSVLDAAIDWQLKLDSGQADNAERVRFAQWLASRPEHERAWRQLAGIDGSLRALAPLRKVLARPRRTRPRTWLGAVLMAAALLSLYAAERHIPLSGLFADQHTHTGERRVLVLADGSELVLNSRSAVDIDFDGPQRLIRLRSGEIAIRTAHGDPRPFVVQTPHGLFRALGTRFMVRLESSHTWLAVLESAVLARPVLCGSDLSAPCEAERRLDAGQRGRIEADGLRGVQTLPEHADAWLKGMLVVEDVTLEEVVAELQRYQPGWLSVAPEVAGLRVTATVPLEHPRQALEALTHALPLRLSQRTGLWLRVEGR